MVLPLKQVKQGVGSYFYRIGSIALALGKEATLGIAGYFCRTGSIALPLNVGYFYQIVMKYNRASVKLSVSGAYCCVRILEFSDFKRYVICMYFLQVQLVA